MRMQIKLAALLLAVSSTGCSALQDRRDAPWDPRGSRTLMDQIPAWDGAANRVCGGHLTEAERRRTGKSPRC